MGFDRDEEVQGEERGREGGGGMSGVDGQGREMRRKYG